MATMQALTTKPPSDPSAWGPEVPRAGLPWDLRNDTQTPQAPQIARHTQNV